jgi:4-amino-4-deoxy-L-arabinose transferase-like glycosyltransferase
VCLITLPALRYGFLRANTFAFDEPVHLQAGYRYWQCGEFANNPEHPPLVKLIAAAPFRHWQLDGFPSPCGTQVITSRRLDTGIAYAIFQSPNASMLLWKARSILIVFPLLLLGSVFVAVQRWFGNVAAAVASILITIEPTLIAHGSLVTTDMAVTATLFLTVALGVEYARQPRWWLCLFCGVALGLALASKHSAILLPFMLLLTMFIALAAVRSPKNDYLCVAAGWFAVCVIGLVLLWASYGFRYSALPHETKAAYDLQEPFERKGMHNRQSTRLVLFANRHHLLPEAYLAGLTDVLSTSERPTYFFGKFYSKGFWYYFPVALSIKLTLGVLVLAVATVLTPSIWRTYGTCLAPATFPAFSYLGVAMLGKMDIGVRHVLPVIPFVIVVASVGASEWIGRSRWTTAIAIILVLLSVISGLHAAPLQLSYANEAFRGSKRTYLLLGDSNVDWGNTSGQLQEYLTAHHLQGSNCAVASGTLYRHPSQCLELPYILSDLYNPNTPPPLPETFEGTLVLQPFAASWSSAYIPLMKHTPVAEAASGTILVYEGKFDLKQVAAIRHISRGMKMMSTDPAAAAHEFALAYQDCSESDCEWAHFMESLMKGQKH